MIRVSGRTAVPKKGYEAYVSGSGPGGLTTHAQYAQKKVRLSGSGKKGHVQLSVRRTSSAVLATGTRVSVWLLDPRDPFPMPRWYHGTVGGHNPVSGEHLVQFDDGEDCWDLLRTGEWKRDKPAPVLPIHSRLRVQLIEDGERRWFSGHILRYDEALKQHEVQYDDSERAMETLKYGEFKRLPGTGRPGRTLMPFERKEASICGVLNCSSYVEFIAESMLDGDKTGHDEELMSKTITLHSCLLSSPLTHPASLLPLS